MDSRLCNSFYGAIFMSRRKFLLIVGMNLLFYFGALYGASYDEPVDKHLYFLLFILIVSFSGLRKIYGKQY